MRRPALHWSVQASVDDETGCWLWTGRLDSDGYGKWSARMAHRVVWENCVGPIGAGLQLDHLCRVRSCVNPDHLEPVTHMVNSQRGSMARISADQAAAIRASDERPSVLVERYGLTRGQIRNIRIRRCWRAAS